MIYEAVLGSLLLPRFQDPEDQTVTSKPAHKSGITAVTSRKDGKVFATGGWDNTVKIWSSGGSLLRTLKGLKQHVTGLSYSADGKYLAASSGDGSLRIWEGGSDRLLRTISGGTSYLSGVAFGKGDIVFTSGYDNSLKSWSAASGKLLKKYSLPSDGYTVEVSPDGTKVAGAGPGGISVFDIKSGKRISKWGKGSSSVLSMNTNPKTGQIGFVVGQEGVMFMNPATGKATLFDMNVEKFPVDFVCDPRGMLFALSLTTGPVILRMLDGKDQIKLEWHKEYVQSMAFSPDGKSLMTGDISGRLVLWDVQEGKFIKICEP